MRSVTEEYLSKLILFGESSLRRALTEFVAHYHFERNHQGKGNSLLFPARLTKVPRRGVRSREHGALVESTYKPFSGPTPVIESSHSL